MTAQEFIDYLKNLPPSSEVLIHDSYLDEAFKVGQARLNLNTSIENKNKEIEEFPFSVILYPE